MKVLCDRCIRAIRSRGENILIDELEYDGRTYTCDWCGAADDELFKVVFYTDGGYNAETEGRNGKCRW